LRQKAPVKKILYGSITSSLLSSGSNGGGGGVCIVASHYRIPAASAVAAAAVAIIPKTLAFGRANGQSLILAGQEGLQESA
jgi:hypothetical protein